MAVEDGRMEMVVEKGGGSGGAEVSVEEVEVAVEGGEELVVERWRGGGDDFTEEQSQQCPELLETVHLNTACFQMLALVWL